MKRSHAAVGSAFFFAVAPGTVAGLLPWLISRWHTHAAWWPPIRIAGWVLVPVGAAVIVPAFVRFVVEGLGTPAPVAAPARLVVGGVYRYVRNPMYVAVIAATTGQALILGQPALLWYALVVTLAMVAFVQLYEQPALRHRFGADYEAYRRNVPGWWPRLRGWTPPASNGADVHPNGALSRMDTADPAQ